MNITQQSFHKTLRIRVLIGIYILGFLGQARVPLFQNVFAQQAVPNTQIVALLVDKDLYSQSSIQQDIERYAKNYIQSKLSNSKAIVFPLNTNEVFARDIAKMLENLYYQGTKEGPSTLEGVILVGNKVPLPVINDNDYIFPSIFPYVDFDNPKYYRDPLLEYFVPDQHNKSEPDIWHSVINLGSNASDYHEFFNKLRSYEQDPASYVSSKIWYDDLIDQKKSFNSLALAEYVNKFVFAEDFAYRRFNPLAVDFFDQINGQGTDQRLNALANLQNEDDPYAQEVGGVFNDIIAQGQAVEQSSAEQVPSVFMGSLLAGYHKSYSQLYGINKDSRKRDNVLSAGRWTLEDIDSHENKVEIFDQLYLGSLESEQVSLFASLNKRLEDIVLDQLAENNYAMPIAIPEKAAIFRHKDIYVREQQWLDDPTSEHRSQWPGTYYPIGDYEAFYYGKNASSISGLSQTSIFLGTPNPLNNDLSLLASQTGYKTFASLGASQGILSDLVEANRGYNTDLAQGDLNLREEEEICGDDNFTGYVQGYLGGNTPLNLYQSPQGLELRDKRYDRGGQSNWLIEHAEDILHGQDGAGELLQEMSETLDAAGSRRVLNPEHWMYAESLQGGFLQRVGFQKIKKHGFGPTAYYFISPEQVDPCNAAQQDSISLKHYNLYDPENLAQEGYRKIIKIGEQTILQSQEACPANAPVGSTCRRYADKPPVPAGQFYQKQEVAYKIIDSTLLRNNPNQEHVSSLNLTTPSRAIDSERYVLFQGIGGDQIQFSLPNLYDVPVYHTSGSSDIRTLKTKDEIKTSIREYLKDIVVQYNTLLQQQNSQRTNYYNQHSTLFNVLGTINPLASPQHQQYTLLADDMLESLIDEETLDGLSSILYVSNSAYPYKVSNDNLEEEYQELYNSIDLTNKKGVLLENYLTIQEPLSPLSLPSYEAQGYEVIALNSDGDDNVLSQTQPQWLRKTQAQIRDYQNYIEFINGVDASQASGNPQDECAANYGEPVPLVKLSDMSFPRFKVFACWLERLQAPSISFDFSNAHGPVFNTDYFSEAATNIANQYNPPVGSSSIEHTQAQEALFKNLNVVLSAQSYSLNPDVPEDLRPRVLITQMYDVDNLRIKISNTGDNTIHIGETPNYTTTTNERNYISPLIWPRDTIIGNNTIVVEICKIEPNQETCIERHFSLYVTPGALEEVDILAPYPRILSHTAIPLSVKAYDRYGNALDNILSPLELRTSTGTFFGGTTGASLKNFGQTLEYRAPKTLETQDIVFSLYDKTQTLLGAKNIQTTPGHIEIVGSNSYYDASSSSVSYMLPNKKSQLYLNGGNINTAQMPQISLALKDSLNNHLAGPLRVYTEQGFVQAYQKLTPGAIISSTGRQATQTLMFDGEHAIDLVLKPQGNRAVGSDRLVFEFPDGTTHTIDLHIQGAQEPARVVLQSEHTQELLDNNTEHRVNLQILDDRGNLFVAPQVIKLESFGSVEILDTQSGPSFGQQATQTLEEHEISVQGGTISIIITTLEHGGAGYLRAENMDHASSVAGIREGQVKQSLIPTTKLNGLYLSLMGNSRGNTLDTSQDYYDLVPGIFKTSKILASTTQLTDPQNIKPTLFRIDPQGNLTGDQAHQRILVRKNSTIIAQQPLTQEQVVMGLVQDRSRGQELPEAIEHYADNFSYQAKTLWSKGSSNTEAILTLIDTNTSYRPTTTKSLESSKDPKANIAWRALQQHLVQFGQGKSVGEATIFNASEFVINYGDPLIQKTTRNPSISGAPIDAGPGQLLVNSTEKTIKKTLHIDINGDGLDDIVTVFEDGSVVWSKQYKGKEILFKDMGPLLQIHGGIKEVYGGDTQGNGYGDIVIQNSYDEFRVYTNTEGRFNVDGYPVCINQHHTDGVAQRLQGIDQMFFKDMDNDGILDIVLNQAGEISIVYGGEVSGINTTNTRSYSYLSTNQSNCDEGRSSRMLANKKTIDHIGTALYTGATTDTSLIRRRGLTQESFHTTLGEQAAQGFQQAYDSSPSESSLNMSNFPINQIIADTQQNLLRWSTSPFDFVPQGETLEAQDIQYLVASELTNSDRVEVKKYYEQLDGEDILKRGDRVKVRVRISGNRAEPITYIDRIQGPREVSLDSQGILSGRNAGTLNTDAQYISFDPSQDFFFVVDNIRLGGMQREFSYTLVFQGDAPITIDVDDRNDDGYLDIALYPSDACAQFLWSYTNKVSRSDNYRSYDKAFIDIGEKLENFANQSAETMQNYISDTTNAINNISGGNSIYSDALNQLGSESIDFGGFFDEEGNISFNVEFIGNFEEELMGNITKKLKDICEGKHSESSGGLPVPFNMAFLSPGEFNIMGCKPNVNQIDNIFPKDGGFPIFAFPANFGPIPPGGYLPLPFPWGGIIKGATDSYGYFGFPTEGGPYSSMIRIYLSPTLTGQVGLAICFGPQSVGNELPMPLSALGGNCIVTKLSDSKGSQGDASNQDDSSLEDRLSPQDLQDLSHFGQCTNPEPRSGSTPPPSVPRSPFKIVGVEPGSSPGGPYNTHDPFPEGIYFGVIQFEKHPIIVQQDTSFDEGGVVLKGGETINPLLQGGTPAGAGMVQCIIDDWMDRQINYIVNNFTNMQIGVYLPDFSQLGDGFSHMSSQINALGAGATHGDPLNPGGNVVVQQQSKLLSKNQLDDFSTSLNNPFEEIKKLFDHTPLINIHNEDIVIKIPMIYSEDIDRYTVEMESRIQRNKENMQDWSNLLQGIFGVCGADYSLDGSGGGTVYNNFGVLRQDLEQTKRHLEQALADTTQSPETHKQAKKNLDTVTQCLELKNIDTMVEITGLGQSFEAKINANIKMLDQYRRFPLKLHDRIHVTDRYLVEISSLVQDFLGYLTSWLDLNTTRFEQYVDAIIAISLALETRQAIPDLSTDRQQRCSNCTVDTYDAYACSLGSLCGALKLPILKLPPFKIPNIYIDMSHIDLGIDITLPNFQFVPESIPLVSLPDLPQPPNIVVNGDMLDVLLKELNASLQGQIPNLIPTIPLLPAPPDLPELPSFIPQVKMELPVLPPAPKLPNLAPSIEVAISAIDFFSQLYCIVKGDIGLVGESNVKTRIEQLTQRNYAIPLFDNINLTQDMSYMQDRLEGFDFQIDAFVNFTLNFDQVYELIKNFADHINGFTDYIMKRKSDETMRVSALDDLANQGNQSTQQNIELFNPFGARDQDNLISLQEEQQNIIQVAELLRDTPETPEHKKQGLQAIIDRSRQTSTFIPQQPEILALQNNFVQDIEHSRSRLGEFGAILDDYDEFLDNLASNKLSKVSLYSGEEVLASSLFSYSGSTLLPETSIMKDYVSLQKKLLGNYDKGLYQVENSSNSQAVNTIRREIAYLDNGLSLVEKIAQGNGSAVQSLNTLQRSYDNLENLALNNQAMVCANTEQDYLKTQQDHTIHNAFPDYALQAQVGGGTPGAPSSSSRNLYSFDHYADKLMIRFDTGSGTQQIDVLQSEYFEQQSKGHEVLDINKDEAKDILHRSNNQSWIKYGNQQAHPTRSLGQDHTTKYYRAPNWNNSNSFVSMVDKNGYLKIGGTDFKITSSHRSTKNLATSSQDYESFSIRWSNSQRQQHTDGYLIELNTYADVYHTQNYTQAGGDAESRFVLLLSQDHFSETGSLDIDKLIDNKSLQDLLETGKLLDIVAYNPDAESIGYSFSNIERYRYYLRIASLERTSQQSVSRIGSLFGSSAPEGPRYTLASPWSHAVVAGQQIIADDSGPQAQVQLIREQNETLIDEGLAPTGLVNTHYRIDITREDPNGVLSNKVLDEEGNILSSSSGGITSIPDLYFVNPGYHRYTIQSSDTTQNTSSEQILLSIESPRISIQDIVEDRSVLGGMNIIAKLNKGLDEGRVRFERKRGDVREVLTNPSLGSANVSLGVESSPFDYVLGFDQTTITGGVYNQNNDIEFYDPTHALIASMDRDTGEITIENEFIDSVEIQVDISSQIPTIVLYDRPHNTRLFEIVPHMSNTIFSPNAPYTLNTLEGGSYGGFAGGECIAEHGECRIVKNTQGHTVVLHPWQNYLRARSYEYDNGITSFSVQNERGERVGDIAFRASLP